MQACSKKGLRYFGLASAVTLPADFPSPDATKVMQTRLRVSGYRLIFLTEG